MAQFVWFWANFYCWKWPNIENTIWSSGHTGHSLSQTFACAAAASAVANVKNTTLLKGQLRSTFSINLFDYFWMFLIDVDWRQFGHRNDSRWSSSGFRAQQYDQMDRLFVKFLAIYSNENLQNSIYYIYQSNLKMLPNTKNGQSGEISPNLVTLVSPTITSVPDFSSKSISQNRSSKFHRLMRIGTSLATFLQGDVNNYWQRLYLVRGV